MIGSDMISVLESKISMKVEQPECDVVTVKMVNVSKFLKLFFTMMAVSLIALFVEHLVFLVINHVLSVKRSKVVRRYQRCQRRNRPRARTSCVTGNNGKTNKRAMRSKSAIGSVSFETNQVQSGNVLELFPVTEKVFDTLRSDADVDAGRFFTEVVTRTIPAVTVGAAIIRPESPSIDRTDPLELFKAKLIQLNVNRSTTNGVESLPPVQI